MAAPSIRILVCGDERVGKSSLISTLVSHHFTERGTPSMMVDVQIPPDESTEGVETVIVDSSAHVTQRDDLVRKMRDADSVVLVHDVERPETFDHLGSFWLPLLLAHTDNVPVVVAGNKVDARLSPETAAGDGPTSGGGGRDAAQARMAPLMRRFPVVVASFECSARTLLGIGEVFYMAQIFVVHPIDKLYHLGADEIMPAAARAFMRIFRAYDSDCDGLLADSELNQFQRECFGEDLTDDELASLKRVLAREMPPDGHTGAAGAAAPHHRASHPHHAVPTPGVKRGAVTTRGFLTFMKLFIKKNIPQTPWKVLRRFGYDESLEPRAPPAVARPPPVQSATSGQVHELAPAAVDFLSAVFAQFDSASAGALSESDRAELFSVLPAPSIAPWDTHLDPALAARFVSSPFKKKPLSTAAAAAGPEATGGAALAAAASPAAPAAPPAAFGDNTASVPRCLCYTTDGGTGLTLDAWLAQWAMVTALDASTAQLAIHFLGFREDMRGCPTRVSLPRRRELGKLKAGGPGALGTRTTLRALVVGDENSGKSALLRRLCGASVPRAHARTRGAVTCAALLETPALPTDKDKAGGAGGAESVAPRAGGRAAGSSGGGGGGGAPAAARRNHLLLTEVPAELCGATLCDEAAVASADVVLLCFDVSRPASLDRALALEQLLPPDTPRIFAGTKADRAAGGTRGLEHSPVWARVRAHCADCELMPPTATSARENHRVTPAAPDSVFAALVAAARTPGVATPLGRKRVAAASRRRRWALAAGGAGVLGLVAGVVLWRRRRARK